jgi:hypothetical protein
MASALRSAFVAALLAVTFAAPAASWRGVDHASDSDGLRSVRFATTTAGASPPNVVATFAAEVVPTADVCESACLALRACVLWDFNSAAAGADVACRLLADDGVSTIAVSSRSPSWTFGALVAPGTCTYLNGTDWYGGDAPGDDSSEGLAGEEPAGTPPPCVEGCLATKGCVGFSYNGGYPACYPKVKEGSFIPRGPPFAAGVCLGADE